MKEFAGQFKGFDDVNCVKNVLLNKELPFGGGIEKRSKDLFYSRSFTFMSKALATELCASKEELDVVLKEIPIDAIDIGLSAIEDFECMARLMEYQKVHILAGRTLQNFTENFCTFLDNKSSNDGDSFSWFTSPLWMNFAIAYFNRRHYISANVFKVLLKVGKEAEQKKLKDEMKTALILTISQVLLAFLKRFNFLDNIYTPFHNVYKLLERMIQSVADTELRSILELVPPYNKRYCDKKPDPKQFRSVGGSHFIKIIWKHLKKIGQRDAASLILANFGNSFSNRYFFLAAAKDNDLLELCTDILNITARMHGFYTTKDVASIINDLGQEKVPEKTSHPDFISTYKHLLKDLDFEKQYNNNILEKNFGTNDAPLIIKSSLNFDFERTKKLLSLLTNEQKVELIRKLGATNGLSKDVREWSRSPKVCSVLISWLVSFDHSAFQVSFLTKEYPFYFLAPFFSYQNIEWFKGHEDPLVQCYLLSSDLLYSQEQKLAWLLSSQKVILFLLKSKNIENVHLAELLGTFKMVLDQFTTELASTNKESINDKQSDSYILKSFLQDFGAQAKLLTLQDKEEIPLMWTLSVESFSASTDIIVVDPNAINCSVSSDFAKKIPFTKVVELLEKYLEKEAGQELIFNYLRDVDIDFTMVEELTDKLLDRISKEQELNKDQRQLACKLFEYYRLGLDVAFKFGETLGLQLRSNTPLLDALAKYAPSRFAAWMPAPYKDIKDFYSKIIRKNQGASKLPLESNSFLLSFENALHKDPTMLAQSNSKIGYLLDSADQYIQDIIKASFDKQYNLFKKKTDNSYAPNWALDKQTGRAIGMLLGRCIKTGTPFAAKLDPTFLSLLLDPTNAKIKAYYKTTYVEDFNRYAEPIKNLGAKELQEGFGKLPVPNVCNVKGTTIKSVSNLLLVDPALQMKASSSLQYLITEYLDLIDCKMELLFYDMVLEMYNGLLMFVNKAVWSRIQNVEHVERLLKIN
ncbi:MAG: hypothetical protein JSR97_02065 [Verrucomicrobia bacterium]|nr:hypothetical protein [Verrucomicrobiota bacterium]